MMMAVGMRFWALILNGYNKGLVDSTMLLHTYLGYNMIFNGYKWRVASTTLLPYIYKLCGEIHDCIVHQNIVTHV